MPDREKIISDLARCQSGPCDDCPYDGSGCMNIVTMEAYELLKAQEPRVLTLEEVQNDCPDYVYLEWLNCCVCCIKDEGESNKSVGYFAYGIGANYYQFLWDTYGTRWRCWTAKPTDEQRKAVKWNG